MLPGCILTTRSVLFMLGKGFSSHYYEIPPHGCPAKQSQTPRTTQARAYCQAVQGGVIYRPLHPQSCGHCGIYHPHWDKSESQRSSANNHTGHQVQTRLLGPKKTSYQREMHFRAKSQCKSLFLNISVQRTDQFLLLLERNIYSPLFSLHKEALKQDSPSLSFFPVPHLTQYQVMMLVLRGTCPTAKGVMLALSLLCNHTWLVVAAWRCWG